MKRLGGVLAALVVGLVLVLIVAARPASAEFAENEIGCAGSVVVTDEDGKTFGIDAEDSEADVPNNGSAAWQGSVQTVTHNHFGAIELEAGQFSVAIDSWGITENDDDEPSDAGTKKLSSALKLVPPGRYDVVGFHTGDEGTCSGSLTVNVAGSPLRHPVGLGALAGTGLFGLAWISSFFATGKKL